ncbi:MAG TPA: response regulator [Bacteroidota bacterium]|nr:response regulator [Bacteroidota bacterium]
MRILVVDDEPEYRLLMRSLLMQEGWEVFLAEDGEEGLQKMAEAKMDLIISDVYMPVMDGLKFHRTVREIPGYQETPFLFVSAYDDEHTMDAVKNPKIEGFLKKGRSIGELKAWIEYLTAPEEKRPKFPPGQRKGF